MQYYLGILCTHVPSITTNNDYLADFLQFHVTVLRKTTYLMASADINMYAQIEDSGVSVTPDGALASSDSALAGSSAARQDNKVNVAIIILNGNDSYLIQQLRYTETELDRIIENEEAQERRKVHLEVYMYTETVIRGVHHTKA